MNHATPVILTVEIVTRKIAVIDQNDASALSAKCTKVNGLVLNVVTQSLSYHSSLVIQMVLNVETVCISKRAQSKNARRCLAFFDCARE